MTQTQTASTQTSPKLLESTNVKLTLYMQITAYLKTSCRWSNGVRAALAKYNLSYTEKDIIIHPEFRLEMEQRSGQPLSPCVEVDGVMLADISGEELEQYLLDKNLVSASATSNTPLTSASCSH